MVMLKTTSLAVLLGSAALSSAADLPSVNKPEARDEAVSNREWKGKLGARGPWRQENDHFLINLDLTGDGAHHNGHGSLIDLNTREPLAQDEILRRQLKSYMQRTEPIISIGSESHEVPANPLIDINVALGLAERDGRLLDLAARLLNGASEATLSFSARDNADLSGLEAAAKDAGVSDDQMVAAKNAVDSLSPDQKAEVENAVKHAMFMVSQPGEKKRKVPGPAFLFKKSGEEAVKAIKQGGNVKVLGGEEPKDTGVFAEKHGAPLLAQPAKRSVADEMGGAPGYIDITTPVFNSTATRLASLVLSTSNGTDENSSFVLNASSSVRTQVFMVPLNSTETGEPEPKDGEMLKVNLKVPVFVAESAKVEPFCATFDPSPNAPEPMTVEPCAEPEDERSQIFLFDPETGAVKPNWTPTESNQQLLASVPDSVSSESSLPSASTSSAISTSASATSSVSASARTASAAPTASASASEVNMMAAASASSDAALPVPTEVIEPVEEADPSASGWDSEPIPTPTATEDWATAAGLPNGSPLSSASVSSPVELPSDLPTPSALPTPALSSIAPEELVTAFANSASAAVPSASAATSHPKSSGNNVTLIFTPANASVQSSDEEEDVSTHPKRDFEERDDEEDCEDESPASPAEIFAFAAPAAAAPSASHVSHASTPSSSASAKPKAKSPKLPEDAAPADAANKVKLVQGDVQVEGLHSLAGRLLVKNWKRQQKVMMAPESATAPYEWTWTSVEDAEKEPEVAAKVFATLP